MNYDPLQQHSHKPNPQPPHDDPAFKLEVSGGANWLISLADLATLPQTAVPDCYIVSTGHGMSGPFIFRGVTLADFITSYYDDPWRDAEIISADGFGNRVLAQEVLQAQSSPPILLATHIDGRPMTREEGQVRLIVPGERDDALRQVKWVSVISIH